jgi:hypothetical protein
MLIMKDDAVVEVVISVLGRSSVRRLPHAELVGLVLRSDLTYKKIAVENALLLEAVALDRNSNDPF